MKSGLLIKKGRVIEFLCLISLFFSFFTFSTIYSYYFKNVSNGLLIIAGLLCLLCLVFAKRIKIKHNSIYILLLWFLTILVDSILTKFNVSVIYYILKFLIVYFNIAIIKTFCKDPLKILYRIIKIFTCWGIICYVFSFVEPVFLPITGTVNAGWTNYNLHLFFIFPNTDISNIAGFNLVRMHSPFSEPGNAQILFNFGVFYELFILEEKKKEDYYWQWIFIACVILTFSLTGFMVLASLLCCYFIKKTRNVAGIISICTIVILSVAVLFVMISDKMTTFSYLDRIHDFSFILDTAKERLPFGLGFYNVPFQDITSFNNGERVGTCFYSGLITPMAFFGVFSLYYYWLLILTIFRFTKNRVSRIAFSLFLIISLAMEPQECSVFVIYLMAYSLLK